MIEVKVPSPGESISTVQLASWLVNDGEYVEKDQEIAEIDSDKATLSISAEEAGAIKILIEAGETIDVGAVVATIDVNAEAPEKSAETEFEVEEEQVVAEESQKEESKNIKISPLAKKLMEEKGISLNDIEDGILNLRVSKADVEYISEISSKAKSGAPVPEKELARVPNSRESERKKMSSLRLKLSERLVAVKNETAMLTTFNEVDMSAVMNLRKDHGAKFLDKHGVKLGLMSFFTKAVTIALEHYPEVNAFIDGDEIQYHGYADVGIAVSAPKGLMVPVLRNAESMSLADIEITLRELAGKARDGKLSLDEMKGGTFTITNGGVFGSMMSTPILNPPQSAILGMHSITDRPVAIDGKVEIRPMMYLALSYDHRIIDGKQSVGFLLKVKELIENPLFMLQSQNPYDKLLDL